MKHNQSDVEAAREYSEGPIPQETLDACMDLKPDNVKILQAMEAAAFLKGVEHTRANPIQVEASMSDEELADHYYQNWLKNNPMFYNARTQWMKTDFKAGLLAERQKGPSKERDELEKYLQRIGMVLKYVGKETDALIITNIEGIMHEYEASVKGE